MLRPPVPPACAHQRRRTHTKGGGGFWRWLRRAGRGGGAPVRRSTLTSQWLQPAAVRSVAAAPDERPSSALRPSEAPRCTPRTNASQWRLQRPLFEFRGGRRNRAITTALWLCTPAADEEYRHSCLLSQGDANVAHHSASLVLGRGIRHHTPLRRVSARHHRRCGRLSPSRHMRIGAAAGRPGGGAPATAAAVDVRP